MVKLRVITTKKKRKQLKETDRNEDKKAHVEGGKKRNSKEKEKKIEIEYREVAKESWKRLKPPNETKRPERRSISGILAKAKKQQKREKEEKSKRKQGKSEEEKAERAREEEKNKMRKIIGKHRRNLDKQQQGGAGCGPKCYIF